MEVASGDPDGLVPAYNGDNDEKAEKAENDGPRWGKKDAVGIATI